MSDLTTMFGAEASNDSSKGLQSSGFGTFGLNKNAKLTQVLLNTNPGGNATGVVVDITIIAGGKEVKQRFFPPTKVWDDAAGSMVEPSTPEQNEALAREMKQFTGTIAHIVKATGTTQESINAALATPPTNVEDYLNIMISLCIPGYQERPVDVFLQWQKSIGKKATVTFLEVPRNMKDGYWIVPAVAGSFTEVKDEEGLRYVTEAGVEHPISKTVAFTESKAFTQQKEGQSSAAATSSMETSDNTTPWK